jgi:hypothetical protein
MQQVFIKVLLHIRCYSKSFNFIFSVVMDFIPMCQPPGKLISLLTHGWSHKIKLWMTQHSAFLQERREMVSRRVALSLNPKNHWDWRHKKRRWAGGGEVSLYTMFRSLAAVTKLKGHPCQPLLPLVPPNPYMLWGFLFVCMYVWGLFVFVCFGICMCAHACQ